MPISSVAHTPTPVQTGLNRFTASAFLPPPNLYKASFRRDTSVCLRTANTTHRRPTCHKNFGNSRHLCRRSSSSCRITAYHVSSTTCLPTLVSCTRSVTHMLHLFTVAHDNGRLLYFGRVIFFSVHQIFDVPGPILVKICHTTRYVLK